MDSPYKREDDTLNFAAPEISDEDVAAVVEVLRSGWITTAGECLKLELELASYLDVPHVVTTSSCTAALEIAVAHLRLAPLSRVGIPTWTFVSTALSAVHAGLTPVLLDIDPATCNLCSDALAAELDEGLAAVIGVHFGGTPLDQQVHELCRDAGVMLIEDAAHALGASDHRGMIAGQGNAGACFSFYATKNLTCAEGGALATTDPDLASFARSYRLHGLSHDAWARYHPDTPAGYDLLAAGIKGNLPDVLAALARSQLRRFPDTQSYRRSLVNRYRRNLEQIKGVSVIPADQQDRSADHLMVVVLPEGTDRDQLVPRLAASGVPTSVHFQPLHTFGWFHANGAVGVVGTANADRLAPRVLSLPLHSLMCAESVDRVCSVLETSLNT